MAVPVRSDFMLDPDLVFLNNGSFGAVPRVVQHAYEELQREMERNPVEWLARRSPELLAAARANVGRYVGAEADDLVFFPNPTTAINMVARTLHLEPGDEVISTDHVYGAMFRTWTRLCRETKVTYTRVHVPLQLATADDYIERVWSAVTPRTRVLVLDRLTSSTALKDRLFTEFRVEAPLLVWNGQNLIRLSFAAYNTEADSEAVVAALKMVLS